MTTKAIVVTVVEAIADAVVAAVLTLMWRQYCKAQSDIFLKNL